MEEGGRLRREHSQRVGSGCGLSFGTDSRACARASVERGACFSCWPCRLLPGLGRLRAYCGTYYARQSANTLLSSSPIVSSTYSGTYFYYYPLHFIASTKACPTKVTIGLPPSAPSPTAGWLDATRIATPELLNYMDSPAQRQQLHWVRAHHDGRGNGKTHIVSSCSNVAIRRLACKA